MSKHNGRGGPVEVPQKIAARLRTAIVSGELPDGERLGHEPDLVQRFGVSRPTLREALRILEAEGLITVARGLRGGVFVHRPDQRATARSAALVLQARNVSLADVFEARSLIEPLAVKALAAKRNRRHGVEELRALIDAEEAVIGDPVAFAAAGTAFHARLVALGGNQTVSVLTEMLDEVVTRAVSAVGGSADTAGSLTVRRRGLRSQRRLLELIEVGAGTEAVEHWQAHMAVVGRVLLGQEAATVVDLMHHYR
ncbi:FadR/GntR family transcriptional regulator [Nocardia aurantia]|nr:GntR family transcriptional regulator [Nocardia aurantia]